MPAPTVSRGDVEMDPKGLVRLLEAGLAAAAAFGLANKDDQPSSPEDFRKFVEKLAQDFKHAMEQNRLLARPLVRRLVETPEGENRQAVAGTIWTAECRAADVDMSQEVSHGQ